MNRKDTGQWSLMLSIHGSGDRLAAQSPPDWQLNAVFYDGAKIKELFGDKPFIDWRDKYGPQRVVLVACQVSQSFNQLVVDALSRSGKGYLPVVWDPDASRSPARSPSFSKRPELRPSRSTPSAPNTTRLIGSSGLRV